jgi:FecR protein
MFHKVRILSAQVLLVMLGVLYAGSVAIAEDNFWRVSKLSGDVAVTASGIQRVSLTSEAVLKPGDSVRTGRNGRVLLVRGEESILIAPNSDVGIPGEKKEPGWTTITQRAGSILLEVEKRNVKHFEVATPYLAAVVKGTHFRVTVNNNETHVDVLRGKVEVSDFKSGQIALVLSGQSAKVWAHGLGGLSLTGSGTFNPIQQGEPRKPSVSPLSKEERLALRGMANGHQVRIASPLGEARLNIHKVTKGLARAQTAFASSGRGNATGRDGDQRGSADNGKSAFAQDNGNGLGSGNGLGNGSGLGNANANGLGSGNGLGNGNANGLGNGNGNGLANGVGNGLINGVGQGNGNNGKAKGKS